MDFDFFHFFQLMLDELPAGSIGPDANPSVEEWKREAVALARTSFARNNHAQEWSDFDSAKVFQKIEGELSPIALAWYEEDAKPVAMFSCYAWGGLMGMWVSLEISEEELLHAETLLPGFILQNLEAICRHLTPA